MFETTKRMNPYYPMGFYGILGLFWLSKRFLLPPQSRSSACRSCISHGAAIGEDSDLASSAKMFRIKHGGKSTIGLPGKIWQIHLAKGDFPLPCLITRGYRNLSYALLLLRLLIHTGKPFWCDLSFAGPGGVTLTYLDVFGGLFIGAREKWWHVGFQFIICQQSHYIPLGFLCARVCGWRGKDCLKWRHRPYHRLTSPTCKPHPLKGLLEMRLKCEKKRSRLFSKRYELTHIIFLKNPSSSPKPQAPTPDPHPVLKNHGTHRASTISVVVVAFQVVRLVEQLLKEKDLATWRCWAGGISPKLGISPTKMDSFEGKSTWKLLWQPSLVFL